MKRCLSIPDADKFSNVENELKKNGVTALKYLVLTHPHDDHIGGASEILEQFEVSEVIMLKPPSIRRRIKSHPRDVGIEYCGGISFAER